MVSLSPDPLPLTPLPGTLLYEFHTRGAIIATAPFLHWTKHDVYQLASKLNVPVALTYSCEADNYPCQRCRSCLDRRLLVPGPIEC